MTIRIAVIGAGLMGSRSCENRRRRSARGEPPGRLRHGCGSRPQGGGRLQRSRRRLRPRPGVRSSGRGRSYHRKPRFPRHAPLSLSCIRAGKRALCEKPLSQSSKECLEIMQAEEAAGKKFHNGSASCAASINPMWRWKQALEHGAIGRALMMHSFHRNVATPASDFHRRR